MVRKWITLIGILLVAMSIAACAALPATNTTEVSPQAVATEVSTIASKATTKTVATAETTAKDVVNQTVTEGSTKNATASATSDLSADEVADLLHMREEEKLARDVYLALYDKWGSRVFQNIARAEQVHMDAVGALLQTYGIEDPVAKTGDARGVFVNPDLQALYEQLVSQGSTSLVDALTVGATIEDLDIKDLNEAMARTTHDDIRQVYENLKMGSENHMRAFVSNLRAQGADYTPQYISMEEFQKILETAPGQGHGSDHDRGHHPGHGQGHGPGEGCGGERGDKHGQGGPPWRGTPTSRP